MKKLKLFTWIALLILTVATVGSLTPVSAESESKPVTPFHFSSFSADYYLSRDRDGFSKLSVKEVLVAEFAMSGNYNHGIERALPKYYRFDGAAKTETHSFDLQIDRVTGGPWTKYDSGDFRVIRIGDADTMVHGTQTYEIDWSATNVTRNFNDGDEFYWNANGTGWEQYFESVEARVHVPADLVSELDGRVKCEVGKTGAAGRSCDVEILDANMCVDYVDYGECMDDGKLFIFKSPTSDISPTRLVNGKFIKNGVAPGETLTFDIGFKPGTFTKPPFDIGAVFGVTNSVFWLITVGTAILTIAAMIWLVIVLKKFRPTRTGRAIIPEYLPPEDMSVAESAFWFKSTSGQQTFFPATLINLAVNYYIEIIEDKKGLGGKKFSIKLLKLPDNKISENDQTILKFVFFGKLTVGEVVKTKDIQKNSTSQLLSHTMSQIQTNLNKKRGFYRVSPNMNAIPTVILIALLFGIIFLATSLESVLPLMAIPAMIVLLIAVIMFKPISMKGAQAKEYLEGLKMYMKLAETERLKILQSVKGAERVTSGDGNIIKLYEKLLPYAVIFGITKDWAKALQVYYDRDSSLVPMWYVGASVGSIASFSATDFAKSINSFSSSGSGFSSGGSGGFSGGGGGGGGGGGW